MASSSGINELMEAEKQASEIVKDARAARVTQMKLAKVEAEKEIAAYRAEQERTFELGSSAHDDTAETRRLDAEADGEIEIMRGQFVAGKQAVMDYMLTAAAKIEFNVPDARKNKKKER